MARKITARGLLKLLEYELETWIPLTKKQAWLNFHYPKKFDFEKYFPSEVKRIINRLERKGVVTKKETAEGITVTITQKGKLEVLKFKLEDMKPKKQTWDKKWRMVFFDIEEVKRNKRDILRKYLKKLGLYQMQESVFVGPFDVAGEIKYLRELLDIPHSVKLGTLNYLENEEDLKGIFGLK